MWKKESDGGRIIVVTMLLLDCQKVSSLTLTSELS